MLQSVRERTWQTAQGHFRDPCRRQYTHAARKPIDPLRDPREDAQSASIAGLLRGQRFHRLCGGAAVGGGLPFSCHFRG